MTCRIETNGIERKSHHDHLGPPPHVIQVLLKDLPSPILEFNITRHGLPRETYTSPLWKT